MKHGITRMFPPIVGGPAALGLLVLRIVVGWAFMLHGWGKIQQPFGWMGPDSSMPALLQALAALSEFGGGLAWILGALTPLASAGILCTMSVATWFHMSRGDGFVNGEHTFEPALVYVAVALLFLLAGPGTLSIDALIFGRRQSEIFRTRSGAP